MSAIASLHKLWGFLLVCIGGAQLLHQAVNIRHSPLLDNFPANYPIDMKLFDAYLSSGRRNARELTPFCACRLFPLPIASSCRRIEHFVIFSAVSFRPRPGRFRLLITRQEAPSGDSSGTVRVPRSGRIHSLSPIATVSSELPNNPPRIGPSAEITSHKPTSRY